MKSEPEVDADKLLVKLRSKGVGSGSGSGGCTEGDDAARDSHDCFVFEWRTEEEVLNWVAMANSDDSFSLGKLRDTHHTAFHLDGN